LTGTPRKVGSSFIQTLLPQSEEIKRKDILKKQSQRRKNKKKLPYTFKKKSFFQ